MREKNEESKVRVFDSMVAFYYVSILDAKHMPEEEDSSSI